MASSLEDDLSCSVCCEVYQEPQLLPCGHSFCCRCLEERRAVNSARTCAVCHKKSRQKPVANLVLRNACESYLKEKERKNDGDVKCSHHGEKMSFFCETDEQVICSECKTYSHSFHSVQPLTQAAHQRKYQFQQTARLIKKDFKKLHEFLREEEEDRIAALREEKERKTENVEEKVEQQILSLSDRVRDVKDMLEEDNVTFLQKFNSILQRVQYPVQDPELDLGALFDVAKHLGNLKYRVWEKMKDLCPYYPVVLDPNTAPADFSISDDLVCVGKSTSNRPSPVPHHRNRIVLGSEGYTDGLHCWDVEVGDSQQWIIGVCKDTAVRRPVEQLTPGNGFWGLSRERNVCKVLGSTSTCQPLDKMPRNVRVKLGKHLIWRTVSFLDASDGSMIAGSIKVPSVKLFPFLIPGEHPTVLRIQQDHVSVTVQEKFSFLGRFIDEEATPAFVLLIVLIFMALLSLTILFFLIVKAN